MTRFFKRALLLALTAWLLVVSVGVIQDQKVLRENLVRMHVVANSDSPEDQALKYQVRDAVMERLGQDVGTWATAQEARQHLQGMLQELRDTANQALQSTGSALRATVTLTQEQFPVREYETFRLPSGIYEALKITIGAGQGENWWCVVFPSLCMPASGTSFQQTAQTAGISDRLGQTLTQDSGPYAVRFKLLDWLGQVEEKLFGSRH